MLSPDEMARLLGQETIGLESMIPGAGGTGAPRAPLYVGNGFGGLGGPSVGPAPAGVKPSGMINTGIPMGAGRTGAPIDPLTMAILGLLATQGPVGGPGPEAQGPSPAASAGSKVGAGAGAPPRPYLKAPDRTATKVAPPDEPAPRFDLSPSTPPQAGRMAEGFYSPGAPPDYMQARLPMAGMKPTPAPGGNVGSASVPKPAPRSPAGPAVAGARGSAPNVEPPPGSMPVAPNVARSAAPPIDANAWRQMQDAWLFDPMARPALGGIQAGGAGVGVG